MGKRHHAPCVHAGRLRVSRAAASIRPTARCRSRRRSIRAPKQKLMLHIRRPSAAKARALALAADPRNLRGDRAAARRQGAPTRRPRPTAPGRPSPRPASIPTSPPCISSPAPSPRRGASGATTPASSPPTPAPSPTGSRARSAPISSWSSWSGCRSTEIKQRIEMLAITEIVLRDLQRADRGRASATICRCRSTRCVHGKRVRDLL